MQPDTIVPGAGNPQAWNRYSYVLGNPLKYTDPSGHGQCQTQEDCDDMGTTPLGVEISTTDNPDSIDNDDCQGDPDCKLDGKAEKDRLWNGSCDRWHRTNCLPLTNPDPGSMPDYVSGNVCFIVICAQVVRDYYNNWYFGAGPGLSPGLSYSLNGGWLLQAGRSERSIQDFTLKWSAFGGGTIPIPHPLAGLGGAVTWGDPSVTRPFDYHDLAGEVQVGNAGGAGGLIYDFWIYDSGDPTPWFWQDKDNVNNINHQQ